jgi:nitroreductase
MELKDTIRKRRTTREFSSKDVENSKIEEIIAAGTLAPSGNHLKQWDFIVIDSREIINQIANCINNYSTSSADPKNPYEDMCNYAFPRQQSMLLQAKYLILPIIKQNSLFKAGDMFSLMHFADTWCAIENMLLTATDLNLSCSIHTPSIDETEKISKIVNYPKEYALICLMGVGYPSENAYYPQEITFEKNRIHKNKW